jgi:hypothetical protein
MAYKTRAARALLYAESQFLTATGAQHLLLSLSDFAQL